MGANPDDLELGFLLVAKAEAIDKGTTPREILMQILRGAWRISSPGRVLVSTSEAGGTSSFTVPTEFGPADVMALAARCISWIDDQPNPTNPDTSRKGRRANVLRFQVSQAPN